MPLSRVARYWSRRFMRRVLKTHGSPRQIAMGAAIGTVVAFTPLMGLHMLLAAVVATAMRCSRIPAIAMVYITNPFTAIPVYAFCYTVGYWILKPLGFHPLGLQRVKAVFLRPEEANLGFWQTVCQKSSEMVHLGWAGFGPLWLGCTVVSIPSAILVYWIALRMVTGHRLLKAERVARRAQRRLERVRQRQEVERLAREVQREGQL